MRRLGFGLFAFISLSACQTPSTQPPSPVAPATCTYPTPRIDLGSEWTKQGGGINWPPNDGAAAAPIPIVLQPGMLIDRFGCGSGSFFSPKGARFGARALPFACKQADYHVYRVAAPVLAWTSKAAPWFGAPGGATQFQTDAPAAALIADRVLEPVPDPGPAPCG